jgi:non-ribosomal peptide synthetase-like protein
MGLLMLTRWLLGFIGFLFFAVAVAEQPLIGPVGLAIAAMATVIIGALYYVLVERLTLGFGRLEPKYVSIYDPYYWTHERHWKVADSSAIMGLFNGTPFKGLTWKLVGVKVGKQLFDDGCMFSERTLVELGDHVTLSDRSTLQGHTMEDATFKSGFIRLGNGVTIGSNCYVNYDVTMGDASVLELDSFLMKGEQVPAGAIWGGNPARQLRA